MHLSLKIMITPPLDTYFIHGFDHWSKNHLIDFIHEEICVSLQKDGHTYPIRPLGFILNINKIIAAYDRDAASKLIFNKRVFSKYSRQLIDYSSDLKSLIEKTPKGKHNELWIKSKDAEIIGGYIVGEGHKTFEKSMKSYGYSIKRYPALDIYS